MLVLLKLGRDVNAPASPREEASGERMSARGNRPVGVVSGFVPQTVVPARKRMRALGGRRSRRRHERNGAGALQAH